MNTRHLPESRTIAVNRPAALFLPVGSVAEKLLNLTRRSRDQRGQKIEKVGASRKVPPKARGY